MGNGEFSLLISIQEGVAEMSGADERQSGESTRNRSKHHWRHRWAPERKELLDQEGWAR